MFLYAANNTKIATFGENRIDLDLGLEREYSWNFCVAAVPRPIIGADLLSHFELVVDLKNRRLIDAKTKFNSNGELRKSILSRISTIDSKNIFSKMLQEFQ